MAQLEMMKLTEIKIQENATLTGANRQKGITKEDLSCKRVTFNEQVAEAVQAKITTALDGLMDQVVTWADSLGEDGEAIKASMVANIASFKLDAGGGYTTNHKAHLVANGTESGVEVLAEDFIAPEKRGAGTASVASSSQPTAELTLD